MKLTETSVAAEMLQSHQKVRRDESVRLVDPALAVFLVVVGWFGLNADARSRGQLHANVKPC